MNLQTIIGARLMYCVIRERVMSYLKGETIFKVYGRETDWSLAVEINKDYSLCFSLYPPNRRLNLCVRI